MLTGLPSLAPTGGGGATGLHDLMFTGSGQAFGVIGFGGNPNLRPTLDAAGTPMGQLVSLPLAGGGAGNVADLAAFEVLNNPGGGTELNSNPYGVAARPGGGFLVADAGANAVLGVSESGVVSALAVLPSVPNTLPVGPPSQPVPTAVAVDAAGRVFVGQLTGFPFAPGAASVYRLDPATGQLTVAHGGFTTIIDLAFGPDGALYVLQLTSNGLSGQAGPPGPGVLFRLDPVTGERTVVASAGLLFPSAVVVGPDGSLYVSDRGTSPGGGRVLRFTPVPEPGTWLLLGLGAAGLWGGARLVRGRRGPQAGPGVACPGAGRG